MKPFISDDFILQTDFAGRLYHDFAKDLPIIDYHNHLPPLQVAQDHVFSTITEIWLKGDHYKWRAMRANGINEQYITGDSTDEEKFEAWAKTVPNTLRNPLYHWTHLELKRYFEVEDLLSLATANEVYIHCNNLLQKPEYSTRSLLEKMKVELICTTDDPVDDLASHYAFAHKPSNCKMLPTFRPDRFVAIDQPSFSACIGQLNLMVDFEIRKYDDLLSALRMRLDHFDDLGCILSDHGLNQLPNPSSPHQNIGKIFLKGLNSEILTRDESDFYKSSLLTFLAEEYYHRNWTMQFHLGALRNNNDRLMTLVGADSGCDSIGDFSHAISIANFLNPLDNRGVLPKTILYNLNPADNELFATMAGNYNDGSIPGKVQWGSGWWFLDQKDGMEKQINALSNMGMLSRFIGMLTDSRSFLSFPRHEYFRRILCNIIGQDVALGLLPNDIGLLGELTSNICYHNAKNYFQL